MSVKNKFITGSVLLVVVALGLIAFAHHKKRSQARTPKQFIFTSGLINGGGDRIINLDIKADEVKTDDETAVITVGVSMPFNFDSTAHYKWKLGEGVSLVEGTLTGQLNGISSTDVQKLQISVKGFSKQINHQVGFEIYGLKNGRKVYGDTIVASDQEKTFEDIVQNVEKIKTSQ